MANAEFLLDKKTTYHMQKNKYWVHESIWRRKKEDKTDSTVNQQKQKKKFFKSIISLMLQANYILWKKFLFYCFFLNYSEKHNYTEISFLVRHKKNNSPLDRCRVCILDLWGGQHWSASGVIDIQFAVVKVGNDFLSALILSLWNLSNDYKQSKGNDDKEDKKNEAA